MLNVAPGSVNGVTTSKLSLEELLRAFVYYPSCARERIVVFCGQDVNHPAAIEVRDFVDWYQDTCRYYGDNG